MTPADDLKPGDWIVIVWMKDLEQSHAMQLDMDMISYPPRYNGEPYQVKLIDLPFVLANNVNNELRSIDMRAVDVQKVSDEYGELALKSARQAKEREQKMPLMIYEQVPVEESEK